MEISGIDKIQNLKKTQSNQKIQSPAPIKDTCSISKSQQLRDWVEMVKQMPEIRPEKIEEALRAQPDSNVLKTVAKQLSELL